MLVGVVGTDRRRITGRDLWKELAKRASERKPAVVGLFDFGSGQVYRASVVEVIEPSPLAHETLRVPDGQEELIPSYYRNSPFSRAWMRLCDISKDPIEFFEAFSYSHAPQLPNYSPATLRRFEAKVVKSQAELTSMDTTIWRVRARLPGDYDEPILLSLRALPEPISMELVHCQSDVILHLSDVHFATGIHRAKHAWRLESERHRKDASLVDAITNALGGRTVGLLVVSGDFTFIGAQDEYDEAAASIVRLLGNLDLSADNVVLVPGNHDIQWTTDATYADDALVTQALPEATNNFEQFYKRVFRHDPSPHLTMGRRFVFPCGQVVEMCGLNSSSLKTGKNFLAGMGRIDEGSFADIANALEWKDRTTLALRVLVVHHHLALTEDLEPAAGYGRGYGLAVDAVRISTEPAARKGVHLAMHGHKHRAFIWRSLVYEALERANIEYRLGELSIIGGGSAGSIETENRSNFVNLLTLAPGSLTLEIFRSMNSGIFEQMQQWVADLRIADDPPRLTLSDWRITGGR